MTVTPSAPEMAWPMRLKNLLSQVWNWFLRNWWRLAQFFWWLVCLSVSIYLFHHRFAVLSSETPTTFDIGLIGLTVVLILFPFISEVSAFGFTVKKQLEEAKKELKQDIREETQSIRNELLAIGISNRLTSNVVVQSGLVNPPPDSALPDIQTQINNALQRFFDEYGIRETRPIQEDISENTIYAFTQRYLVEREIKRIWSTRIQNGDFNRYPPFSRMVDDLVRTELITADLGASIREVFRVASAAIHGEEPSQEKIDFLRQVMRNLLAALNSIQ